MVSGDRFNYIEIQNLLPGKYLVFQDRWSLKTGFTVRDRLGTRSQDGDYKQTFLLHNSITCTWDICTNMCWKKSERLDAVTSVQATQVMPFKNKIYLQRTHFTVLNSCLSWTRDFYVHYRLSRSEFLRHRSLWIVTQSCHNENYRYLYHVYRTGACLIAIVMIGCCMYCGFREHSVNLALSYIRHTLCIVNFTQPPIS